MKNSKGTSLRFHRLIGSKLSEFLLFAIVSIQFLFNSRVGDDWPNSNSPNYVAWRYGSLNPNTIWHEIQYWTAAWANGQGRFFPVAVGQAHLTFSIFQTQKSIRVFYAIVFICMCLIWVNVIRKLSGNPTLVFYFILSLPVCIQFRWDFEPHIGFAQLVVWALIWFGLSLLALLKALDSSTKTKQFIFGVIAGSLYFTSLCQYELTFLLFPILIYAFLTRYPVRGTTKLRLAQDLSKIFAAVLPTVGLTICYLWIVFIHLRPRAQADGAYVLGFDFLQSLKVFTFHLLSTIPFLSSIAKEGFGYPTNPKLFVVAIVMAVFFVWLVFLTHRITNSKNTQKSFQETTIEYSNSLVSVTALTMILTPAIMISFQPAWWDKIEFGSSYLGIVIGEIGMAILIAQVITLFHKFALKKTNSSRIIRKQKNRNKHRYGKYNDFHNELSIAPKYIFIYSICLILTFSINLRMTESTHNRDNISASWQALVQSGKLTMELNDADFLLSTTFNDAYEINVAGLYKLSGVRLAQIMYPPYLWGDYMECTNFENCPLVELPSKARSYLANSSRSIFPAAQKTKDLGMEGDWPSSLLQSRLIDNSKYYYFNIYMITQTQAVAYLGPLDKLDAGALVNLRDIQFFTMNLSAENTLNPSFRDFCLENQNDVVSIETEWGKVQVTSWKVPSVDLGKLDSYGDPRVIQTGTC
jgi:hypothetical protein